MVPGLFLWFLMISGWLFFIPSRCSIITKNIYRRVRLLAALKFEIIPLALLNLVFIYKYISIHTQNSRRTGPAFLHNIRPKKKFKSNIDSRN